MDKRISEIIDFAEIGDFIYRPIKIYSSGMLVRMAFAAAINVDPDILIIDEAIAVGDIKFQQKCFRKLREFQEKNKTIILVSHDMSLINLYCDKAVLLDKGLLIDYDIPSKVTDFYNALVLKELHQGERELEVKKPKKNKVENEVKSDPYEDVQIDSKDIELVSYQIVNEQDEEVTYIISEKNLKIIYEFRALKKIEDPHFGISIRDRFGNSCFNTNTYCMGIKTFSLIKGEIVKVTFDFCLNLSPGDYTISFGVANKGFDRGAFKEYLIGFQNIEKIKVIENPESILYSGYFNMNPEVSVKKVTQ
jgi:lipopolysaccharide transport system ATP-binding protein